eukprot:m51a1_g10640 hypothetical protein (1092) ;mRNA; r:11564-15406
MCERTTVVTSALVVIPPESAWPAIQAIRRSHDRSYVRWMPHINVMYPFVPEGDVPAVAPAIAAALARTRPFKVTLSSFRFFQHSPKSFTMWLAPEPAGRLCEVRRLLDEALPGVGVKREEGYTPHLSVGQWRASRSAVEAVQAQLGSTWSSVTFVVDRLCVITRRAESPFSVRLEIPLGCASLPASPAAPSDRSSVSWDGSCWSPADSASRFSIAPGGTLKFATWNVMEGRFSPAGCEVRLRAAAIVRALRELSPDVVGLQEVDPEMLELLRADEWVRSSMRMSEPHTDCGPSFQILLSRLPFVYRHLQHSKNKRTLIARVEAFGRRVHVAVVHLVSDVDGPNADRRALELREVREELAGSATMGCVLLGDFNFGDEEADEVAALSEGFSDCWRLLRPADLGLTFDPESNPVACATTRTGKARRLDRIAVARAGSLSPLDTGVFAREPSVDAGGALRHPSDHYGVWCVVADLPLVEEQQPCQQESGQSLESVLSEFCSDPDEATTRSRREAALEKVRREAQRSARAGVVFSAIGSQLLGVQEASSDIDVVCASAAPRRTFFVDLLSGLHQSGVATSACVVSNAIVPVLRYVVDGFKFEIQYACVPEGSPDYFNPDNQAKFIAAIKTLDEATVRAVCGYLDNQILLRIATSTRQFASLMHYVRLWAKNRGLYSGRTGYLGGFGWAVLACRVVQQALQQSAGTDDAEPGLEALLVRFFEAYADFDFACPVGLVGCGSAPQGTSPLVVLTPSRPHLNVTRNATKSAVVALCAEFARARTLARSGKWRALVERGHCEVAAAGGEDARFAIVTISAEDVRRFRSWRGFVESRLVSLVVGAERLSAGAFARLWPEALQTRAGDALHEYTCSYFLIVTTPAGPVDLQRAVNAWTSAMAPVTPQGAALSVRCWSREKLPSLFTSDSWWLATAPDYDDTDLSAEEMSADDVDALLASQDGAAEAGDSAAPQEPSATQATRKPQGRQKSAKEAKGKKGSAKTEEPGPKQAQTAVAGKKEKMRTSSDVFNRVRWDPSFNPAEWTVGYEDRFLGMMEVPLEEYDTENIPFHRVWLFKRRGEIVWDRENRVDMVFAEGEGDNSD